MLCFGGHDEERLGTCAPVRAIKQPEKNRGKISNQEVVSSAFRFVLLFCVGNARRAYGVSLGFGHGPQNSRRRGRFSLRGTGWRGETCRELVFFRENAKLDADNTVAFITPPSRWYFVY